MGHPDVKIEKIEVTDYFKLKHSSKKYYITLPPQLVNINNLMVGDFLKITLLEAKRIKTDKAIHCPKCGSIKIHRRRVKAKGTKKGTKYECLSCGETW